MPFKTYLRFLLCISLLCLCGFARAAQTTASSPAFWPSYLPPPAEDSAQNDGVALAVEPAPAIKLFYPQALALIDNSDRVPYVRFEWLAATDGALALWGIDRFPRDGVWQARWGVQPAYAPLALPLPSGMAARLLKIVQRETAAAKGALRGGADEAYYVFGARAADGAFRYGSTRGSAQGTPAFLLREITVCLAQLLRDAQSPRSAEIIARMEALLTALESGKTAP